MVSSPAKGQTFAMLPECGNLQDLFGSMATNTKFHFHTTKLPARSLYRTPARLRGCIFSPQHTKNPSPYTPCLLQIRLHGLGVGIITSNEPSQVLENFHSFQWFLVAHKNMLQGLLGMHGGRKLTPPLPPPLTQLSLMVTSVEILTGVCSPHQSHFGKGREPSTGMQTRSWGCCKRKCWRRLYLVPACPPHCGTWLIW